MRIVLFSGSHNRHYFLHSSIINHFNVVGVVHMERENVNPQVNFDWSDKHKELFSLHFEKRKDVEKKYFGEYTKSIFQSIPNIEVKRDELNTSITVDFLSKLNFDAAVIFGVDIIKDPIFSMLPFWKINVHLGLSPWYKGAATLFWPFYFLEPQFSGATIHLIAPKADAGEIIHHSIPEIKLGSSLHEHSANVVLKATSDLVSILKRISAGDEVKLHKQKVSGKLFLERDFRPEHLELIYSFYNDKILDLYLNGKLNSRKLNLINHEDC